MNFTIHRGAKQIGGSCVELQADSGERILLDIGMPLTRPDGSDWPSGTMTRPREELRAEGVLPNIDGLYAGASPKFSALVLSHAHLDHHGLAHHVHPDIPVYCSRGTIEMLKVSHLFVPGASVPKNIHELPLVGGIHIGPFLIQGIPVDHAAPDSRALRVEADGQRILYSGDLRAHGRHPELFDLLPERAALVDVLILEGTTIGQTPGTHGYANETDVEHRLTDLLRSDLGFVAVIASGQNIDRAISVYQAALASKRELVLDPYQAYFLMTLRDICPEAPQFDWPGVRVKFIHSHVEKLKEGGFWGLACKMSRASKVKSEQLAATPEKYVYLARSSGATVALLRYLSKTKPPSIVWSQWSGYLKKVGPVPRFCQEHNIEPVVIHSGGHAHPKDLTDLVSRLKPRAVVPIHTEAAGQFATLMPNVCIVGDHIVTSIASLINDSKGETLIRVL
jgi:ribonuclease J